MVTITKQLIALKSPMECGCCGGQYMIVPIGAKLSINGDVFDGAYFDCNCMDQKTTIFVPVAMFTEPYTDPRQAAIDDLLAYTDRKIALGLLASRATLNQLAADLAALKNGA